eukprot:451119-Pleurochrysis_carterae.AAC.2
MDRRHRAKVTQTCTHSVSDVSFAATARKTSASPVRTDLLLLQSMFPVRPSHTLAHGPLQQPLSGPPFLSPPISSLHLARLLTCPASRRGGSPLRLCAASSGSKSSQNGACAWRKRPEEEQAGEEGDAIQQAYLPPRSIRDIERREAIRLGGPSHVRNLWSHRHPY